MRKLFFLGLITITPIVLTVYVIIGIFKFADGFLGRYINYYLNYYFGYSFPGLGIFITFFLILFVGVLVRISKMRLLKGIEILFSRLPLVNRIYFPIKKILEFLFLNSEKKFKEAVLVEYPRNGIYSLGFITNRTDKYFEKRLNKAFYNVFIPSSPSPLTGFTIIVPEEEIIFLDISIEKAISLVVSGGLLNPQDVK